MNFKGFKFSGENLKFWGFLEKALKDGRSPLIKSRPLDDSKNQQFTRNSMNDSNKRFSVGDFWHKKSGTEGNTKHAFF